MESYESKVIGNPISQVNVVIVEDDLAVNLHMSAILKKYQFNIQKICRSGEEAIAELENNVPDIILMDVFLQGEMNGIETVKIIKERYDIPVIFITSSLDNSILQNAKSTLPDGFLRKPFSESQLFSTLEISLFRHGHVKNRIKQLIDKTEFQELHLSELSETNSHLIAATWRERDMKKKLADTIEELNKTKLLLEAQNKRVAESINYSRKIQLAINTTEQDILKIFDEAMIFYKPKDVISGDFPWMFHDIHGSTYLAAVDCTGHGVPGAMLSMIGNLLLNEIINVNDQLTPGQVLLELHRQIVSTLKQDLPESNSNDGMDIAMIKVNKDKSKLFFSGAHRPLILLRNGRIDYYSGDKFPVGGIHYKGKNNYSDTEIEILPGDKIFIFSDGIVDQIGGAEGKKWMINGLKDFILENGGISLSKFGEELENKFYMHKKDHKQIDDLLVIGIKI